MGIADYVEEIRALILACNATISHIFQEGNKLADHLAKYALDVGDIECHSFADLDSVGRRIVNDDKLQCPYLRIRATRN